MTVVSGKETDSKVAGELCFATLRVLVETPPALWVTLPQDVPRVACNAEMCSGVAAHDREVLWQPWTSDRPVSESAGKLCFTALGELVKTLS